MWKALRVSAPILSAALFVCAASCSSPREPVAPTVDDSPRTPVVIDSKMADWVIVPNAQQVYDHTDDGLLRYTFQLQNRTEDPIWIRYVTTFFDASGVIPVDEQPSKRKSLAPTETVTITVVSANPAARTVKVQILKP